MFHPASRCCLLLLLALARPAWAETPLSYSRDVLPILAEHCFACHGPDPAAREADLRLDLRESALAVRDDQAVIAPQQPEASLFWQRINSPDPDLRMPPPVAKKPLTDQQRIILRTWIEQGAAYQQHWAFQPVRRPALPKVADSSWVRNGVDHFILARLEQQGVSPSPAADRRTLARRVALDLCGLPPSPEMIEDFVNDASPQAYERLVDRLLASQHYGERWGRLWLDQARYADSHGYTIDGPRVMWPYRDWVIHALNSDMPFDQFTIEQLAGDLLPRPSKAQLVATGFHRNTLINQEGGTDNEQFRNEEVVDRVNTTGAVWLGLTVGCAQCHSHKFDPITQQEYYQLFAFFNHGQDVNNVGPTVEVRQGEMFLDESQQGRLRELEVAEARVAKLKGTASARQVDWEKLAIEQLNEPSESADWETLPPVEFTASGGAKLTLLEDGSVLAGRGAGNETYTVTFDLPRRTVAALRLRVLPHASLPHQGPGLASNGNFILTELIAEFDGRLSPLVAADASHAQPGYPIQHVIDHDDSTGWAINIAKGSRAKMNSAHEARFVLQEAAPVEARRLTLTLKHDRNGSFYNIGRFAVDAASRRPPPLRKKALREALQTPIAERDDAQIALLANEFAQVDTLLWEARQEVETIRQSIGVGETARTMVMGDLAQRRPTYVHVRGDFLRPDKQLGPLEPGVPAVLPPLRVGEPPGDAEAPREKLNRLDLARWLVRADHPLTSRVTVNRTWMRYFGRGLVQTENDFGAQGALPTHPDLLDWLAAEFMDSGWSWKQLHRLIVTSATYRQSSHARADVAQQDPRNLWLARQQRLRLDSELIRDSALAASGLLHPRIGGPSVHPPQPDGVYAFTQNQKSWPEEQGSQRYRRAMYTMFYRSAPYPLLTTFDSPDYQSVCTRRVRSNTPLQTLTLANDLSLFELAEGVAARVYRDRLETPEADGEALLHFRIRRAYLVCLGRLPAAQELDAVARFFQQQQARYEARPPQRASRITWPSSATAAERGAWTAVARALMNTDEFINRE